MGAKPSSCSKPVPRTRPDPIPATSLAAVQPVDANKITVEERPTPVPLSRQVLVELHASGVCATDLHLSNRSIPLLRPSVSVGGHEGVGVIASLGPDVDTSVWKIGDRVGVRWLYNVCRTCEACRTGYENLCPHRRLTGKDVEGCFGQYVLGDSDYMVRLPDAVDFVQAAPVLCAGVTVYKGLKVSDIHRGSWVAVSGAGGGLGHLAIGFAHTMGYRVVALDVGKRDFCLSLGAEVYVDVLDSPDSVAEVIKVTDGGAHAALVCASVGKAYIDAVRYLRRAGRLVCIGIPEKKTTLPVTPEDFVLKGIKVVGTSTGTIRDTEEALGYVAEGKVKTTISERPLAELKDIFAEMETGRVEGKIVLTTR